jgi:hypothetical protein
MAPPPAQADPDRHLFRGFDASMTRMLGADLRLLYGIGVPIVMIVGLIIVLALNPAKWVVAVVVVCEIGGLALIVTKLYTLMSDDDEAPGSSRAA